MGKNKRGSHVGMIISFVVFITFIIFLYSIVKPAVNTGQDKKTLADYLLVQIVENVSANFTSISVSIGSQDPMIKCIKLSNFLGFVEIIVPYPLIIKNENQEIQPGYIINPTISDLEINRNNGDDKFFKAYYSQEFGAIPIQTIVPCQTIIDYTIGSVKTEIFPFENNLNSLIENYQDDYEKVKEDLKVPPGTEFNFEFIKSDGTKVESGETPTTINIYATETPIQYIDDEANILSGFINIKVW